MEHFDSNQILRYWKFYDVVFARNSIVFIFVLQLLDQKFLAFGHREKVDDIGLV